MQVKKVISQNGAYTCDIGITKEEWKEILSDTTLLNNSYKDALIKFYKEPDHKATCKALGEKYSISAQSLNGTITAFAKAVQRRLNRFEVIGIDGNPTYWIIPMTGKYIGEYFEWTLRKELVMAIEEAKIKPENALQSIYNEAIKGKHWVFDHWFPQYEKYVSEYIHQAKNKSWTEECFKRLIKDTTDNGISDLKQKNFEWDEFRKIKANWAKIEDTIQWIASNNRIDEERYKDIISFFRMYTNENRPSASNRVIAAFLPNYVTTIVKKDYLNGVIWNIKALCADYPEPTGLWLKDNINFIEYCNSNIKFEHPWHSSLFAWCLKDHFEKMNNNKRQHNEIMEEFLNLLKTNRNIILTGSPGTGKTYLAKQMAISMLFGKQHETELNEAELQILNEHFCFVQFHPSYDYTDFVEGLRAEDLNGQVLFRLHNGIFKGFCKRAITPMRDNFDDIYENFINDIAETDIQFETPQHRKKFRIEINSNKSCVAIPETIIGSRMSMTKEMIRDYIVNGKIRDWKPYLTAIGDHLKNNYDLKVDNSKPQNLPYIFVIDEINRGEISKIFGELFFSMDPGYRGKNGKVKTQNANIQNGETIFDHDLGAGWFYVPENVYIIGTMNDIDRSVECMDFAMRRRFAWREVKAIDRITMWDGVIDDWKEEAMHRMVAVNNQIECIQGLGPAFHIGPAYFLNLKYYDGNFEQLWENHIRSILLEYLRGFPNIQEEMALLKIAYDTNSDS